jgi:hypothetical protein
VHEGADEGVAGRPGPFAAEHGVQLGHHLPAGSRVSRGSVEAAVRTCATSSGLGRLHMRAAATDVAKAVTVKKGPEAAPVEASVGAGATIPPGAASRAACRDRACEPFASAWTGTCGASGRTSAPTGSDPLIQNSGARLWPQMTPWQSAGQNGRTNLSTTFTAPAMQTVAKAWVLGSGSNGVKRMSPSLSTGTGTDTTTREARRLRPSVEVTVVYASWL